MDQAIRNREGIGHIVTITIKLATLAYNAIPIAFWMYVMAKHGMF